MKISYIVTAALTSIALTACGSFDGRHLTKEGTIAAENVKFPDYKKASYYSQAKDSAKSYGTWPTKTEWTEIQTLTDGQSKAQVRNLIGSPHFTEGFFSVKRWDYVLNFYDKTDGRHRICQLAVLFDKNGVTNERWFLDVETGKYGKNIDTCFSPVKAEPQIIIRETVVTPLKIRQ